MKEPQEQLETAGDATAPAKIGRPSDYTPEIALAICDRIASGESLRTICTAHEMPDKATVFRWLAAHEAFRDQYARAREAQADALAEEILDIADETSGDFIEKQLGDEGSTVQIVDHEHISRSKLRVDARKWLTGKLAPKKYGDRMRIGADETAPPLIPPAAQSPEQARQQVLDEIGAIFGAGVPADRAAANAPRGDRVVRRPARKGRAGKPGAPAPG